MHLSLRGFVLALLPLPLLALGLWQPAWLWAGWIVALGCEAALFGDWWLAQDGWPFDLTRQHETKLSLGEHNAVQLQLRNPLARPLVFQLRDEPPDEFDVENRLFQGQIAPGAVWRATYQVRPYRRGNYAFGDLTLRWRGPLGLVIRHATRPLPTPVKVYPNLLDLRRYDLLLRRNRLQEFGLRALRQRGEGADFESLRDYQPDDDFRRINWKATARRQQPITAQYQVERSQTVLAVLDVGRLMQSPVPTGAHAHPMNKLDYVVNAVLLLGYVATGKGDKIGLMTFSQKVHHDLAPAAGRRQFYQMLEALYGVEPHPIESDYDPALTYLALKQRKRALIVIFTDLSQNFSLAVFTRHIHRLARTSLILVVTLRDPAVQQAAQQPVRDSLSAYARVVAAQLLEERQRALDQIRRRGVLVLDIPAHQLSVAVIDRYLELKARTQL